MPSRVRCKARGKNKARSARAFFWKFEAFLLARHVISLFSADPELLIFRGDLYGTELPVGLKSIGLIEHGILAAQLFMDIMERIGHVLKLEWEERLPARGFRQHLQAAVAFVRVTAQVCADGVNDHAGPLRHLNSFLP